jgi:anti-sigma regulatory factor (Ser/Thr protein kinase)
MAAPTQWFARIAASRIMPRKKPRTRQKTTLIRQFITDQVSAHPTDIAKVTAAQFKISAQAARNHLQALEAEGALKSSGNTRSRKYELVPLAQVRKRYKTSGLQEDVPWSEDFLPHLDRIPENVRNICSIVFTEMVNNVIDHSESKGVEISMLCTAASVKFRIRDAGVGIFKKIKLALKLREERAAILELAKGKFTTSPNEHSGYGIFFSCRMVDIFSLRSGELFFTHIMQPDGDWLIETRQAIEGTHVEFTINTNSTRTSTNVYEEFCGAGDEGVDMGFKKTHVPIKLAQYGAEKLVSRSQAKRVLSRFESFDEVLLDFADVEFIGQAFADEIFRVFAAQHSRIQLAYMNANRQVQSMIHLAQSASRPQTKLS